MKDSNTQRAEVDQLRLVRLCPHDPRTLAGKPIGQYHCPECEEMVIAGMPHHPNVDPARINREVRNEGGAAETKLKAKCRWEGMSRTAVIKEWGDPRSWPNSLLDTR